MSTKKSRKKLMRRPNKSRQMICSVLKINPRKSRLKRFHFNLTSSPLEQVFSFTILSSCTHRCTKEWKMLKRIPLLTRSSMLAYNFWSNSCTLLEIWLVQMMKPTREMLKFSRPTSFTMTSALYPSIPSCFLITESTLSSSLLTLSNLLI